VPCEASQVLVVSGSQQTLDLAAKLYIDKGTEILLEAPTYLAALQIFQLFGADCLTVPLQADGPDLAQLRTVWKTPPGVHLPDPDVPESIGRALQRSQARCRGGVARRVRRDPDRRRALPRTDLRRRQCHADCQSRRKPVGSTPAPCRKPCCPVCASVT
jgi:hypothetical protein